MIRTVHDDEYKFMTEVTILAIGYVVHTREQKEQRISFLCAKYGYARNGLGVHEYH